MNKALFALVAPLAGILIALGSACSSAGAGASAEEVLFPRWRFRDGREPIAQAADFDDSAWEVIDNAGKPRGPQGVSFGWYRTTFVVPDQIDGEPIAGRALRLAVLVDDYAEVFVEGEFKQSFKPGEPAEHPANKSKGHEIAGFNKPNVINLGVREPGAKIRVAVLAINGPIHAPIGGYFIRYARIEFAGDSASQR
jgi:hypothetical protein